MKDMAPALLERLQALFENNLSTSRAGALLEKIAAGKAGYADAGDYAEEVGRALADAFAFITGADLPDGRMYWNSAGATDPERRRRPGPQGAGGAAGRGPGGGIAEQAGRRCALR